MFELPELEYAYNALEPFIDEETMRIHHQKHHKAYTDKFNAAIEGTALENLKPCQIISNLDKLPADRKQAIINHGGGYVNHKLFWRLLSPEGGEPEGKLADAINSTWGNFEEFKKEFSEKAATLFGSGWVWLVKDGDNLEIITTQNQDSPMSEGKKPIMLLDVWEHAYYLKYQNRRAEYIEAFWNVVNWKRAGERFDGCCGCPSMPPQ